MLFDAVIVLYRDIFKVDDKRYIFLTVRSLSGILVKCLAFQKFYSCPAQRFHLLQKSINRGIVFATIFP